MRRSGRAAASVAVAALLLMGCGGSSETPREARRARNRAELLAFARLREAEAAREHRTISVHQIASEWVAKHAHGAQGASTITVGNAP
jgi:hypothetical protein